MENLYQNLSNEIAEKCCWVDEAVAKLEAAGFSVTANQIMDVLKSKGYDVECKIRPWGVTAVPGHKNINGKDVIVVSAKKRYPTVEVDERNKTTTDIDIECETRIFGQRVVDIGTSDFENMPAGFVAITNDRNNAYNAGRGEARYAVSTTNKKVGSIGLSDPKYNELGRTQQAEVMHSIEDLFNVALQQIGTVTHKDDDAMNNGL